MPQSRHADEVRTGTMEGAVGRERLHRFAYFIQSRVQFLKVARRTATSIILVTVLLAGIITPIGVCALLCERHSRAVTQRHCSQASDAMPGMAHAHSAMDHPGVDAKSSVLVSQSCRANCDTAERLNVSRNVIPQVTVIQSGTVILDIEAELLTPDPGSSGSSDSSPPSSASAASFSILRI